MKMRIFVYCLISMMFVSKCNTTAKCDNDLTQFYEISLVKVQIFYSTQENDIAELEVNNAVEFLMLMSDKSSSRIGTPWGIMYNSIEDYNYDISRWQNWLNKNRCDMTIEVLERQLKKYNIEDDYESWLMRLNENVSRN